MDRKVYELVDRPAPVLRTRIWEAFAATLVTAGFVAVVVLEVLRLAGAAHGIQ
jgi:hypothetical protein